MENLISIITNYKLNLTNFVCEIIYLIGIIFNFIISLFAHKKRILKEVSDCLVISVFTISFLVLFYLDFINNSLVLDNDIIIKFFLNLFFLFFAFIVNPLTNKYRHRAVNQNSALLFSALFGFLILKFVNPVVLFLMLEFVIFYIYKYGIYSKIIKSQQNFPNLLAVSISASVLFYLLYFSSLLFDESIQLYIFQTCIACAILLKIGIFPLFNYSINNQDKSDIPFSILLFNALPLIGLLVFIKIVQNFNINNQIFQLTLLPLLLVSAFSFALSAFWQKDLVKFVCKTECFFVSFAILNFVLGLDGAHCVELAFLYSFCALAVFSLISILKINANKRRITTNTIKGLYFVNKPMAYLFSMVILIYLSIFPSKILFTNINALKNMYSFDVLGVYLCFIFVILNVLILLNGVKIIQNIYFVTLKPLATFKKATTPNYVIAFLIILFILISCYL